VKKQQQKIKLSMPYEEDAADSRVTGNVGRGPHTRKGLRPANKHLPKDLIILHEDEDILVVVKPAGLLTMGTDRDKSRTAYAMLTDYVRKGCSWSPKRIFIVHRLDRDTSGILIFAKSMEAKLRLQGRWEETGKKYLAVVHGHCRKRQGTITTYLAENKAHLVYSTSDSTKGKLAHTAYTVLRETKEFSLLEVDLLTGRKHQIRVHLAETGHPVVGDEKYGEGEKAYRRLALHAKSISFTHPINGKRLMFETGFPEYFHKLVGSADQRRPDKLVDRQMNFPVAVKTKNHKKHTKNKGYHNG
jgi:tRNA pseudouridine32 synthase/23S rRNA pseudouridine746 synthase/23S rRNA pseudouridine1911/1915/1917 synthase